MKKQKLIAFWKYDLYPYLLWGEIDSKTPPKVHKNKMTYYILSYQFYVAPAFVLEGEKGRIFGNYLERLTQDRVNAQDNVDTLFNSHLKRLLYENGIEYTPI